LLGAQKRKSRGNGGIYESFLSRGGHLESSLATIHCTKGVNAKRKKGNFPERVPKVDGSLASGGKTEKLEKGRLTDLGVKKPSFEELF